MMTRALLIIALLPSFFAATPAQAAAQSLKSTVFRVLPQSLRVISPGRTTIAQVHSRLGKPAEVKGANEFYSLNGVKYDTTITTENGVVKQVYFQPTEKKLYFKEIDRWVTEEQRTAIEKELHPETPSHESGVYFTVDFASLGLTLKFVKLAEPRLFSVVMRRPSR